ncbi:major facilitator superfamily domain-containing protein [Whalleya microplaca]|nr:major facilitator superfamily domain-containing protein [Whalleya microplaca]
MNGVEAKSASDHTEVPMSQTSQSTFLAVFAVCLIYFAQLVNLVGAGAQGQTIATHFGETGNAVWLSAPITILTVVLGPIVSQAADYWGRKWFLVISTTFGAIGSIIVARASSMSMAIGGFTVLGVAYGTQPLLHTVTSEVLPRRWRAYGQATDMLSNCLGSVFGLLVGGALNRTSDPASDSFRTYYYITMAIFFVAAVLCALVYNPPAFDKQKQFTTSEKLGKLDWIGYFLLASGLVLFSVGLAWFKNPFEFSNPDVAVNFALGLGLAIALVIYESFFKRDGMFHHSLFNGNRNFSIALFCVFSEGVAFFAANTYFAFQVSVLYETDNLLVATRYSIILITAIAAALATGWYCAAAKKVRWATFVAFLVFVAFFACMATTTPQTSTPVWGYSILMGIGLGMTLTTLVTAAQLSTPPELIAIASGLIISIRSLGGTIGIAIYNALLNTELSQLADNIAGAVIPAGLSLGHLSNFIDALTTHDNASLIEIPGVTPEIIRLGTDALLNTYATAFRHIWTAAACFVALAAIVSVFLFDPQKEFNMHIDAPVEKEDNLYPA